MLTPEETKALDALQTSVNLYENILANAAIRGDFAPALAMELVKSHVAITALLIKNDNQKGIPDEQARNGS